MENSENILIRPEESLEVWAMFFNDEVEDMIRNASCFVIMFSVIVRYIFSKGQVSQNPYLYCSVSLIWASIYATMYTNAHKMINSMTPKSDPKWCETWPRCLAQSLQLTYHYTFSGHHFYY